MNTHEAVTWIADALERPAPDLSAMPPALCPRDLPTGHALQDPLTALLASRGRGATIGWKVGSTTPAIEMVGDRYGDFAAAGAPLMASDQ